MCNSLIWELMAYKFKLGNNATVEITKNKCYAKSEGMDDQQNSNQIIEEIFLEFQALWQSGKVR